MPLGEQRLSNAVKVFELAVIYMTLYARLHECVVHVQIVLTHYACECLK